MKRVDVNLPTLMFVVVTRAALGAGVGLLLAGRLSDEKRRLIAGALIALGAATTVPAVLALRRGLTEMA